MKKTKAFILFFICLANFVFAQNKGLNVYTDLSQPNPKVQFKLINRVVESKMLGGQPFCCKIKNLTNNRLEVGFNLVANTTCGNSVSGMYEIYILEPNELMDLCNGFNSVEYGNIVTEKDCAGESTKYISSGGYTHNGINRIKSIEIIGLIVKEIVKDTIKFNPGAAKLANNSDIKTKKELTDDEKLNQVLMNKLEKDFDEKQKSKPVITNVENSNTEPKGANTKLGDKPVTKENSSAIKQKINEYKKMIVDKLNNSSFNYSHTSREINYSSDKTKIRVKEQTVYDNCYWEGNTLIYTKSITTYYDNKEFHKYKTEVKANLDLCNTVLFYEEFNGNTDAGYYSFDYDKIIYEISDKEVGYRWFISSDNKTFINSLKEAFDFIIMNK